MRVKPPVKVSQEQIVLHVEKIEAILQGPSMDIKPFPPAYVELRDESKMLIREAKLEEVKLY